MRNIRDRAGLQVMITQNTALLWDTLMPLMLKSVRLPWVIILLKNLLKMQELIDSVFTAQYKIHS